MQAAAGKASQRLISAFKSIGRGAAMFFGVPREYLNLGWKGVGGWFSGMTLDRQTGKFVGKAVPWQLFKRYGRAVVAGAQIYAPFWLVSIPFKAGDGLVDYSRRRIV